MKPSTRDRHYQTIAKALSYLQQQQYQQPPLAEVAKYCAVSEHHFQRIFTEWAGISPKQFLQHLTRQSAKSRLLSGASLSQARSDSGLSSNSRLHDLMVKLEAATPGEIKSKGSGMSFYWGVHHTPFGDCFIATTDRGIHTLVFICDDDQTPLYTLQQQWPKAVFSHSPSDTQAYIQQIFTESLQGNEPDFNQTTSLKVWTKGSAFQFKVWEALLAIPSGSLSSYGSIAQTIGQPSAARAVGSAVGKNSVAVLIPCHRVIQSMGEIGHYRWGKNRKLALLGTEACRQDP